MWQEPKSPAVFNGFVSILKDGYMANSTQLTDMARKVMDMKVIYRGLDNIFGAVKLPRLSGDNRWITYQTTQRYHRMYTQAATPLSGCAGDISEAEFETLQDLYSATQGSEWNWLSISATQKLWSFPSNFSAPCSDDWEGVYCTPYISASPNISCTSQPASLTIKANV